ncbi:MAG: histidine--tRNA ligase [Actinomycetota bacterium]
MAKAQGPRGAPDLLPPDSTLLTELEDAARGLFDRYGYGRIETPIFEHTDVFQRAAGETSEIVLSKQMYTFTDRRERSFSLRPEATAGIARSVVEHDLAKREALPLRLYMMSWFFRYERPQKGRTRQFHQIDAEAIGSPEPTIDAELIALASQFFDAIGMAPRLHLNSMGDAADRERYFPVLREAIGDRVDEMCDDCHIRLKNNPLRVFDCKVAGCKKVLRSGDIPPVIDYLCDECRAHYASVQEILESLGIAWTDDPHLVRGFDYYTRTVFEFDLEGFGARSVVCGGGRYDGLVELLGGPPTPAAGFAVGTEPVMVALRESRTVEGRKPDVFVVWTEGLAGVATATALDLRKAGLRVVVSDVAKSFKAQMRSADRLGARRVVILGADEVAKQVAKVKDMESGSEREVGFKDLAKDVAR